MIEHGPKNTPKVEAMPEWIRDPRLASIQALESPEVCTHCNETIPQGSPAMKETQRRTAEIEGKAVKERKFVYYHPHHVPRPESEAKPGTDMYDRGRRLPGGFETGKRH